jgi:membrane protein implicated in regulation of membrane protease activity
VACWLLLLLLLLLLCLCCCFCCCCACAAVVVAAVLMLLLLCLLLLQLAFHPVLRRHISLSVSYRRPLERRRNVHDRGAAQNFDETSSRRKKGERKRILATSAAEVGDDQRTEHPK